MTRLILKTVTSRTAAILLLPEGTRYHLGAPLSWKLFRMDTLTPVRSGQTAKAPLFLEHLDPDTEYRLSADGEDLRFRTARCAGLVHATAFGVSPLAQDNCEALSRAIEAVPPGGTLVLPEGTFLTRPLFLRPSLTLWIPAGTTLRAVPDREAWPILPSHDPTGRVLGTWEGLPEASHAALLTGIDCHDLSITGAGTVDGGGAHGDWWSWPKETRNGARRARTLFLAHCEQVSLSGLTVTNSPSWTIHPFHCRGLKASALTILNPADSPNTDGFNPESCRDVDMSGIHFSVGDDCIAIKSGKRGPGQLDHLAPTERLTIAHCLMERGHGAVVLGSEMSGDIRDVTVSACEFSHTDRGVRLKTRRGRGGTVERIRVEDVIMDHVDTALAINAFYFCDADGRSKAIQSRTPAPVDHTTPRIRNVTLERITATNVRLAGIAALGLPEAPVTGIVVRAMTIGFDPQAMAEIPLMADQVPELRHRLLYCDFAEIDDRGLTQCDQEAPAC
ncbi:glycoside hydrolase family 28 protein [Roseibium aestuarii]|uniref:Glycoside hydrolase family 28 protein n=1 Tax=Roseibium aestuarii TaxID=2600299 RepID=A0ABW4JWB8_9HYPH|nr:glycoside hydrolase family 28 protein [Roseibium aestuarii]